MENESAAAGNCSRLRCYCWKCFVQADFFQDFGSIQEFRCPKCYVRVRLGDPEHFDPLRTPDDDSDSVSVCVSTPESRRSTITYSESEGGASDDVDPRQLTPESFQQPSAPTNTPAAEGDVPDAPPNIANAFADVTNYLLSVPTPRRRSERFSLGGLTSTDISGGDFSYGGLLSIGARDSVSPSKMIENVMHAYQKLSVGEEDRDKPKMLNDGQGRSIEILITQSSDEREPIARKVSSTEIGVESSGADKND